MTIEQRNEAILKALESQTREKTRSKAAARAALIKGGIYTAKGNLKAEFGGRNWKAKAAI